MKVNPGIRCLSIQYSAPSRWKCLTIVEAINMGVRAGFSRLRYRSGRRFPATLRPLQSLTHIIAFFLFHVKKKEKDPRGPHSSLGSADSLREAFLISFCPSLRGVPRRGNLNRKKFRSQCPPFSRGTDHAVIRG